LKTATILPQNFLHLIKDEEYHMTLAHLLGKDGFEEYTEFYTQAGHDPNKFVIMDTGLIEGDARPTEELVEKAHFYMVDEMALNDVFMDHAQTLKSTYAALKVVDEKAGAHRKRLMGIPQGTHLEDWIACAKEMLSWEAVDTIGVPKVLTKLEGRDARLKAIHAIQQELAETDTDVHLLGCWESPLELKIIENAVRSEVIAPVRGVDSAIAYAYAREGLSITSAERPEGAINFAAQKCDEEVLAYNIAVWKREAEALPPLDGKTIPLFRIY
jgi:hypothetical protein